MIKPQRIYYTDAMRSILMLLGVVAHSSYIFTVSSDWLIHDAQSSPLFDTIAGFLLMFRMPAFFIVSGFFCHMTLTRYGARRFLNVRLTRIAVPLITTAIVLNGIQNYVLAQQRGGPVDPTALFLNVSYWFHGEWVDHLWFLNCLLVFFLVSALIYTLFKAPLRALAERLRPLRWVVMTGLYLLLVPLFILAADYASYRVPITVKGAVPFLDFYELLHYGVFFAFGFLLGTYPTLMDEFPKLKTWALGVLGFFVLIKILFTPDDYHGIAAKILFHYSDIYISWYLCAICFYIFRKYFDAPSKTFTYLSDASYSIYLFHHMWVVMIGIILIPLALNIYLKFTILLLAATAISFAIHHFAILRSPLLRYLFNGKTPADSQKLVKATA